MEQSASAPVGRPLVLVVHAHAGHSRPVEALLEGAGYEVVSAGEADEIELLFRYGQPDLVVVAGGNPSALPATIKGGKPPVLVLTEGGTPNDSGDDHLCCTLGGLIEKVRVSWGGKSHT